MIESDLSLADLFPESDLSRKLAELDLQVPAPDAGELAEAEEDEDLEFDETVEIAGYQNIRIMIGEGEDCVRIGNLSLLSMDEMFDLMETLTRALRVAHGNR